MIDLKFVQQDFSDRVSQAIHFFERLILDLNVRGESHAFRRQTPRVDVMDFIDLR